MRYLPILAILILLLTTCTDNKVDYNNKLVQLHKTAVTQYNNLVEKVNNEDSTQGTQLAQLTTTLQKTIDSATAQLQSMKVLPETAEYTAALQNYIATLKQVANKYNSLYVTPATANVKEAATRWLNDSTIGVEAAETLLKQKQKLFAEKFGYSLQ